MLDLQALEAALAPIEELGREERTFQAGDHTITLRVLTPDEEKEVQRYTQETMRKAQGTDDQGAMMEFLDRFKVAVLSYAIIQIDDLDLRAVTSVSTGEVLDNGVSVKVPRHEAVRRIMSQWTRPLLVGLFGQYGALLEIVEKKAEAAIKWEPADLQAEIDRLEKRILELRVQKQEQAGESPHLKQVNAIQEYDQARRDEHLRVRTAAGANNPSATEEGSADAEPEGVESTPIPEPDPDPEPPTATSPRSTPPRSSHPTEAPGGRRPAIPTASAPPVRAPEPPPRPPAPEPVRDEVFDSMSDLSDDDALAVEARRIAQMREAQMGEEHERALAQARARALEASKAARRGEAVGNVRRRQPPHRQAANTVDAALDTHAGAVKVSRPPGAPADVEAFRMPTQVLSRRGAEPRRPSEVELDSSPKGTQNPRFAHPKKR